MQWTLSVLTAYKSIKNAICCNHFFLLHLYLRRDTYKKRQNADRSSRWKRPIFWNYRSNSDLGKSTSIIIIETNEWEELIPSSGITRYFGPITFIHFTIYNCIHEITLKRSIERITSIIKKSHSEHGFITIHSFSSFLTSNSAILRDIVRNGRDFTTVLNWKHTQICTRNQRQTHSASYYLHT